MFFFSVSISFSKLFVFQLLSVFNFREVELFPGSRQLLTRAAAAAGGEEEEEEEEEEVGAVRFSGSTDNFTTGSSLSSGTGGMDTDTASPVNTPTGQPFSFNRRVHTGAVS